MSENIQDNKTEKHTMSIEEGFANLDLIIAQMEDKNTSLEDSFACYQKGIEILKECNASLDRVEKQIQIIGGNDNFRRVDENDPF